MHADETTALAPASAFGRLVAFLETLLRRGGVVAAVVLLPVAALRFLRDQCIQWAAALAYYTLIGLAPLLLVVFSGVKALGLHRGLTPFVMQTIGAGSPEMSIQIVRYIDEAQLRAVGILSAIAAALAVFAILGNAEMCFNAIWGGVRGRSLLHKLRSYASVAVVAPLVLTIALAATTILRRGSPAHGAADAWYLGGMVLWLLRLLPYALLWSGFTMLYRYLPNVHVSWPAALVGAVVAGTMWQFAEWGYVTFVISMVRAGGLYGALWQVPILLAWIYIAWAIILSGAQVCRAYQEAFDQPAADRVSAPAPSLADDAVAPEGRNRLVGET
jgi:membrane protein